MWILHRRHFHALTGGLDAWLADGLGSCPLGYYAPANYCVSSPSNHREAIQKIGNSCPLGWFTSGNYCLKSR